MKQKKFSIIYLFFIFITTISAQIVNEGIFKIEPSTDVYFGFEYTNKVSGTHTSNGNLYLNSNFVNDGVTSTPTNGTTSFNSSINAIQTISGINKLVKFYNLNINNTLTGVSVSDNFELQVVNAVALTSGDLRLVGEAQLTQNNNVANSTGTGKLLRDQQGISSTYGYNYWSSPVNNGGTFSLNSGLFDGTDSALNSFTPQPVLFNIGAPYDGIPSVVNAGTVTTPLYINESWLYTYSPNDTGYAGWQKITQSSTINAGVGYTMKGTGLVSQNYVFKGVPNNGDYSFFIAGGQDALLGNPYPSAIDVHEFILDNINSSGGRAASDIIDGNVYFWVDGGSNSHNLSDYLGAYAIRNLSGGVSASVPTSILGGGSASSVTPKPYMSVGQGFFVESPAGVGGNVIFKNSQRIFKVENATDSQFYKSPNNQSNGTDLNPNLDSFIRIGYEDPESFHRQLLLSFLPNSYANLNFNLGYDAIMFDPREDELFYIIENDLTKKYVIQGVGSYDVSYEFPIGLKITQLGIHTIMLDGLENFTDKVYIKDNVLNTLYDLTSGNYNPNLPVGEYLDRFSIVFMSQTALAVSENSSSEINVHYTKNNNIIINNRNNLKLNNVFIVNMLGQKIMQVNNKLLLETEISIPFQFKKGMYMVLIESEKGKETFKIVN